MADQYTENKRPGYFTRFGNSFIVILLGAALIAGSVWLLFSNEGRPDLSTIARTAVEINAGQTNLDETLNGKLVSVTGAASANALLDDGAYLKPGRQVVVKRTVEMFSWAERQARSGGTAESVYTYDKKWSENPARSSGFRYPQGHDNPAKALASASYAVRQAKVGAYEIDTSMITFPPLTPLVLNEQKVNLPAGVKLISGQYLYAGEGKGKTPQVGDLRISYAVLPEGTKVTVFGKLTGNLIGPYLDTRNNRLYRMFSGDRETAIGSLHGEFKIMFWLLRLIGFLLMWIGLSLVFEPLAVRLDVLPWLGTAGRWLTGTIIFLVALGLTVIIIITVIVAHNVWALLGVLAALAAAIYGVEHRSKK